MGQDVEPVVAEHAGHLARLGHPAIWYEHLGTGRVVQVNGEEAFPAASLIKVAILAEAFRQAGEGRLDLGALHRVDENAKVGGAGILRELHSGLALTLLDLLTLMIIVSDNTATNMVIELAGMAAVNGTARRLGLTQTVLRRKLRSSPGQDRPDGRDVGENTTSAKDMALLLKLLAQGKAISPAADAAMVAMLEAQQVDDRLPLLLPRGTRVAHKTGNHRTMRHDAGLVFLPGGGAYVLTVLLKDLSDTVEASLAIARLSRDVYRALIAGGGR